MLQDVWFGLISEEVQELDPSVSDFRTAQLQLLQAFKQKQDRATTAKYGASRHLCQESQKLWARDRFEPKLVPVVCVLPKQQTFQGAVNKCL